MKIFISSSSEHREHVAEIVEGLKEDGHQTVVWSDSSFSAGKTIQEQLNEILTDIDAVIVLWSAIAANSSFVNTELGYFLGKVGDSRVIPVLLDDSKIPSDLAGILYIDAANREFRSVIPEIKRALGTLQGRIEKKAFEQKQRTEKVERISEEYIKESIENLSIREHKYKIQSYFCYVTGFLLLVIGIATLLVVVMNRETANLGAAEVIQNVSYMVVIIGFLAAAARYAFVLGRSFMVEALRNYDRIHAIKFGEFYLKTYGDNIEWEQLKEAFQHWNIDSGSNFKEQDEKSIDPQILKSLVEILKQTKAKA